MSDSLLSSGAKGGNAGSFHRENAASVKPKISVDIPLTRSQIDSVEENLATIFGEDAPSGVGFPYARIAQLELFPCGTFLFLRDMRFNTTRISGILEPVKK